MKLNTLAGALIASLFVVAAPSGAQDTPQQPGAAAGDVRSAKAKNDIFLPLPGPSLDNFKKPDLLIDPKVWQMTDPADVEMIKAKHARIPRHVDMVRKVIPANKPDRPELTQTSNDFQVLGDGYLYVTTTGGGGRSDTNSAALSWMGLLAVYLRSHVTIQSTFLIEGTVTLQLDKLAKFEIKPGSLAPGATFGWDRSAKQQTYNHVVGPLHTTSNRTQEKDFALRSECTVNERIPAAQIYADFTGNALKISCAQSSAEEVVATLYYLEDYAWFLSGGGKSKNATVEIKITGIVQ